MARRLTAQALGERGIIRRIARRLAMTPSVLVGIGDDAAVLRRPGRAQLLLASDMCVEGVHFLRGRVPAERIGWKALAVNVSDIAAMGGVPHWAVVSLGLPPSTPAAFIDGVARGLNRCARRFRMAVVGGDTVRAPQVVIDVAIVGSVEPRCLARRSGARVGDALYVTGRLGGSYRTGRHARFLPRVAEARRLVTTLPIHAMMDLSDGLAADLGQMSRASGVTLEVDDAAIPVAPGAGGVEHAYMDGEDFELLFAVAPRDARRVPRRLGDTPVTRIGRVTQRGAGVWRIARSGRRARLVPKGFAHFAQ